jgi:hypothetical protein
MSKNLTKKTCERIHATKRAQERYGLEYTKEIRDLIKYKIQNNKTILVQRVSNTRTVRLVDIEEYYYKIVWDSIRQEIVTFLPFREKDMEYVENPNLAYEQQKQHQIVSNNIKETTKKLIKIDKEIFECIESFKDFMFQLDKTKT